MPKKKKLKLVEELRNCGILNEHDLLRTVAQHYRPLRPECLVADYADRHTRLWSPLRKLDPENEGGYRRPVGARMFYGVLRKSMPEALEWAEKNLGIIEWSASPFNPVTAKVPTGVRVAAEAIVATIEEQPYRATFSVRGSAAVEVAARSRGEAWRLASQKPPRPCAECREKFDLTLQVTGAEPVEDE